MTTDAIFAVFEDFNEPRDEPHAAPEEDASLLSDGLGEMREEAWTDGYLTGRQERSGHGGDPNLTARLLTAVHELDCNTARAVDEASLAVAGLLVSTVIAVTSEEWSVRLLDRVRAVADRIRPALTIAPEFLLRDDSGTERRFSDISALSEALEGGITGEDVTIRWHRGEATISRMALLEDLRDASVPLSADRMNEQRARHMT